MQGRLLHAVEPTESSETRGKPHYSDVFKANAVSRVKGGQAIAQVARDLGVARNTLKAWIGDPNTMPAAPSSTSDAVLEAARTGSRKAVLIALRDEIAGKIAAGVTPRDLPVNARLLHEVMREIEAIEHGERQEHDLSAIPDAPFDPRELGL
ncbi:transposase [Microbacterium sp. ET2]|uniref:transposase n=1 Tax=Microbacterium albipurpureum TaxID=3050384 RepID=UPI00259CE0FD|nr:transposase [Microbacterium sp. ET2 (Ac-2212)]WJL97217.1 transposase [Microbacterium sp. ET2 (Ac-2212)]